MLDMVPADIEIAGLFSGAVTFNAVINKSSFKFRFNAGDLRCQMGARIRIRLTLCLLPALINDSFIMALALFLH